LRLTPKIVADLQAVKLFQHATIAEKLIPRDPEGFMTLCLLGYVFRQAVKHRIKLVLEGAP